FSETVRKLDEAHRDLNFAILGAASDKPIAQVICAAKPESCLDLTGGTSLREMVEWLRFASLVISNDTGPLHVAAALKRPLIAIYGPSDPTYTGPYAQQDAVLQTTDLECVPCMSRTCSYEQLLACLRSITPGQVCSRARAILARS